MNEQWKGVGQWLLDHAGQGAALVGSLLTGNAPGAIAAGVSLVQSATGQADPQKALNALQTDPQTVIKLQQLANDNEADIRRHLEAMAKIEADDAAASQRETQTTIRAGDTAEDPFVRRTRPAQSWLSLIAALIYVFLSFGYDKPVDTYVLGLLLALPWAYAGLREVGKGINTVQQRKALGAK